MSTFPPRLRRLTLPIWLFLSLLTMLPLAVHAALHSAVDPAPRTESWWQDRHKQINQKVTEAGKKASVIFIGDSITQGWESEGKEVWGTYYAGRNAVNLGIGGDRTQHVLWRLDHGNLDGLEPKVAVVMIGTNNSNGEDNTPGQIVEGISAIVAKLREKLPTTRILLLGIFPRGENFSNQRGKVLQVNQVIRRLADDRQVFWEDFGYKFVNSEGSIPKDLMPDYLHLSPKGYGIWAESIEAQISKWIGDAPVTKPTAALSGDWIWKIQGPDGNPVEAALVLEQNGTTVTGKFARGTTDRWLQITDGKVDGNQFSWIVTRDRAEGGQMVYRMSGTLQDGKITGLTKTFMNGQEVTVDWSARRK